MSHWGRIVYGDTPQEDDEVIVLIKKIEEIKKTPWVDGSLDEHKKKISEEVERINKQVDEIIRKKKEKKLFQSLQ